MVVRFPTPAGLACVLAVLSGSAAAQSPRLATDPLAIKTLVEVEILMPERGNSLDAQTWGPVFEKIGVAVRFREAILDDKPAVDERLRGTYRTVTAIGQMDSAGVLHFPEKSFGKADSARLEEWLNELKSFGALGSPDGKPVWGLTEEQFTLLYGELSKPLAHDVAGLTLADALQRLELPAAYPMRLHSSAEARLSDPRSAHPVRPEVGGFSAGTGIAILLADYGLGFRPLRSPQGKIELVVEPLSEISHPWPIGWKIDETRPRNETAPALFAMVKAGFNDLPLADVLNAVAEASGTPIVIDYERCAGKSIDPAQVRVSYPSKQTAWMLIIRTVTAQARLAREIMQDEAGRVFVYTFPFESRRADHGAATP